MSDRNGISEYIVNQFIVTIIINNNILSLCRCGFKHFPHIPIGYWKQPAEVWVLLMPFYKWGTIEAHIG